MARLKKFEINWDDNNSDELGEDLFSKGKPSEAEENFEAILSGEEALPSYNYEVGERVKGFVMKISTSDDIFVDIGSKIPASIAKLDLTDEETGKLKVKEGDSLEAFIISKTSDTIILSNSLSHKVARASALEEAYHSKIPVQAKVVGVNKGGYELELMGQAGFCPLSQMESYFVEDPKIYIGKKLDFIIASYNKKQSLLSRRRLQEEKAKTLVAELFDKLEEKPKVMGVVTNLKDFGAHILIDGCLPAFLHVSEISFGHIEKIAEHLDIGQKVTASVLDITGDFSSDKLPRVSLSLKALQDDPWETASKEFVQGASYTGKVERLMPFGAFVSLKPGIEGLLHVSEMSWVKRVRKPEELLKTGDMVSVRVLEIDPYKKKMSLSLKSLEEDPWHRVSQEFPVGSEHEAEVTRLKAFGSICELKEGLTGLVPKSDLQKKFGASYKKHSSPPHKLKVCIREINKEEKKILLGFSGLDDEEKSREDFKEYLSSGTSSSKPSFESSQKETSADSSTFSLGSLLGDALKKKK